MASTYQDLTQQILSNLKNISSPIGTLKILIQQAKEPQKRMAESKKILEATIQFWEAIDRNDLLAMQSTLSYGANINMTLPGGSHILKIALLEEKSFKIIRWLVEQGADLHHPCFAPNVSETTFESKAAAELASTAIQYSESLIKLAQSCSYDWRIYDYLLEKLKIVSPTEPSIEWHMKEWNKVRHSDFSSSTQATVDTAMSGKLNCLLSVNDKSYFYFLDVSVEGASCLLSYDFCEKEWVRHYISGGSRSALENVHKVGPSKYWAKIQAPLQILTARDNQETLYLLTQGSQQHLILWSYQPKNTFKPWSRIDPNLSLHALGQGKRTIVGAISNNGESLFLLARVGNTVELHHFSPKSRVWKMYSAHFENINTNFDPKITAVQTTNGKEKCFILLETVNSFGNKVFELFSSDMEKHKWLSHGSLPQDSTNIQMKQIQIQGKPHLAILALSKEGVSHFRTLLFQFDCEELCWRDKPMTSNLIVIDNLNSAIIQMETIPDLHTQTDILVLLNLNKQGLTTYAYHPLLTNDWISLPQHQTNKIIYPSAKGPRHKVSMYLNLIRNQYHIALLEENLNSDQHSQCLTLPIHVSCLEKTLLLEGIKQKGPKDFNKILHSIPLDINQRNAEGFTLLQWAVKYGSIDAVLAIIEKGADLSLPGPHGDALTIAALLGNESIVALLVAKGAKCQPTTAVIPPLLLSLPEKHAYYCEMAKKLPAVFLQSLRKLKQMDVKIVAEDYKISQEYLNISRSKKYIRVEYTLIVFNTKVVLYYPLDLLRKGKQEIPGLSSAFIALNEKNHLLLQGWKIKSDLVLNLAGVCYLRNMEIANIILESQDTLLHTQNVNCEIISGKVDLLKNHGNLKAYIFELTANRIINRGRMTCGHFQLTTADLDNYRGYISSYHHLIISVFRGECDNRYGRMEADLDLLLTCMGRINNCHGYMSSNLSGEIKIRSMYRVDCLDFSQIRTKGNVIIISPFLNRDETSLILGSKNTQLIGLKVKSEATVSSTNTKILGHSLDIKGVIAKESLDVQRMDPQWWQILHPIRGKNVTLLAQGLVNRSLIQGEVIRLVARATNRLYSIINHADIEATRAGIRLETIGFLHESGRLSAREDIHLPFAVALALLGKTKIYGNVIAHQPLRHFDYVENINIVKALQVTLANGLSFTKPFRNTGSLQMTLASTATLPIKLLADISCGKLEGPGANLGHLSLHSPTQPLIYGDKDNQRFIRLTSSGHTSLEASVIDVIYGSIIAGAGAKLKSGSTIHYGRIPANSSQVPSALAAQGLVEFDAPGGTLLEGCEFQVENLHAKGDVDSCGTDLCIYKDATFEGFLNHRRLTQRTGAGDSSVRAANLIVGGTLGVVKGLHLYASSIHARDYRGPMPTGGNFLPFTYRQGMVAARKPNSHRWHDVPWTFTDYHAPCTYEFAAGNPLNIQQRVITIAGAVIAPTLQFSGFENMRVGLFDNSCPIARPWRHVLPATDFVQPSALLQIAPKSYPSFFKSIFTRTLSTRPEPMVLHMDGRITPNLRQLKTLYDFTKEIELLPKMLIEARGYSFDGSKESMEEVLHKFSQNVLTLKDCDSNHNTALVPELRYSTQIEKPLWLYTEVRQWDADNQTEEWVLVPFLHCPKHWNNSSLRSGVGGIFALTGDIVFQGMGQGSLLEITAHAQAKNGLTIFKDMNVVFKKRLRTESHQYNETITKKQCGVKHTSSKPKTLTSTTELPSGILEAQGVQFENVGYVERQGFNFFLGHSGMKGDVKSYIESAAIANTIQESHAGKYNLITGGSSITYHARYSLLPCYTVSLGPIDLTGETQYFQASQYVCLDNVQFHSQSHTAFGAIKVEESLIPIYSTKGLTASRTTGYEQRGMTCNFQVQGKLSFISNGDQYGFAPHFNADTVYFENQNGADFEEFGLYRHVDVKSSGVRGFQIFNSKTQLNQTTGSVPIFVAQNNIVMFSKAGSLILVAPTMISSNGNIMLKAPEGNIVFEQATFEQDIRSEEFSISQSFFGSKAVEAAIQGHFKDAAAALLREFPILNELEALLKSKETADKIGNGIKVLYQTLKLYQSYANSKDALDFLKGQIALTVKNRLGMTTTREHSTEAILTWLQARDITISAKNIQTRGLQGQCDTLLFDAQENMTHEAGETTYSKKTRSQGVSLGFDISKATPTVGVDWSQENINATRYLNAHFNVAKLAVLKAGNKISMKGVVLKANQAILEAEELHVESLQNKMTRQSTSIAAGTDSGVSLSSDRERKLHTEEQTAIHAQQNLILNIRKHLTLIGAAISVGGSQIPLALKTETQTLNLYLYDLPNDNEDSLFLALGVPRSQLLTQLLSAAANLKVKGLLLPEIQTAVLEKRLASELYAAELNSLIESYAQNKSHITAKLRDFCLTFKLVSYYLNYVLSPGKKIDLNQPGLLEAIALTQSCNIKLWEKKDGVSFLRSFTSHPDYPDRYLCYDSLNKKFALLHPSPGLIRANEITYKSIMDIHKRQGYSVSTQGDLGGKSQDSATLVHASVDARIDIKTRSEIAGLHRDPNHAREELYSRNSTMNLPLGSIAGLGKMATSYENKLKKEQKPTNVPVESRTASLSRTPNQKIDKKPLGNLHQQTKGTDKASVNKRNNSVPKYQSTQKSGAPTGIKNRSSNSQPPGKVTSPKKPQISGFDKFLTDTRKDLKKLHANLHPKIDMRSRAERVADFFCGTAHASTIEQNAMIFSNTKNIRNQTNIRPAGTSKSILRTEHFGTLQDTVDFRTAGLLPNLYSSPFPSKVLPSQRSNNFFQSFGVKEYHLPGFNKFNSNSRVMYNSPLPIWSASQNASHRYSQLQGYLPSADRYSLPTHSNVSRAWSRTGMTERYDFPMKLSATQQWQRMMRFSEQVETSFCNIDVQIIDDGVFRPYIQRPIQAYIRACERHAELERQYGSEHVFGGFYPGLGQAAPGIAKCISAFIPQTTNETALYCVTGGLGRAGAEIPLKHVGYQVYDKSIPMLKQWDRMVFSLRGQQGWRHVRNNTAGRKQPVPLTSGQIGGVMTWEKSYNKFMRKYHDIKFDVRDFNNVTKELLTKRTVNKVKDQLDPATLAARLKELDGHVIYSEKLGRPTDHYKKIKNSLESLDELVIHIDVQIQKFEKNGYAKFGELEYLRIFSRDIKETCDVVRRLGEMPCGFPNVPKP